MNSSITYDNVTLLELCPTYSNHERQLVTSLAFWLDGILKSVLAIFGLLFNLSASYVLYQPKMRNSFNKCLIAKSGIDSIFLMISIVECFRRRFHIYSQYYMIFIPQFIYPLSNISLTASIYMTVAISLERYCAAHYPMDYRQTANDSIQSVRRMWRYLGPTLIASVLLNIPKFFELCVVQNSDGSYSNNITDLRRNTTYSVIAIWSRLILTGSLPLFVIIFFNFKTYQDVRERRLRTFRRNNFNPSMNPSCCSELKDNTIEMKKLMTTADSLFTTSKLLNNPTERILTEAKSPTPSRIGNSYSENRRKDEDKLAVIFLVIILIFVFCHLPRVGIDIHEIYSLSHSNFCAEHNMPNTFPAWSLIAIYISHFCLVISAASNMFIYCLMSTKFREESRTILSRFW